MNKPATPYKAYSRASTTVGKTRQVVMLYDGVIRFLQQAAEAMEKKQIEERYKKLTRAGEVLMGLQSCLDFNAGGQAAHVLHDFYSSIDARLLILHRTNDRAMCLQLVDELKQMREVWNRIDRGGDAAPAGNGVAENSAGALVDPVTVSA